MAFCGPSCAVPSCASAPLLGLGSPYSMGCGYGLGYSRLGYGSPYYSYGTSASSLGLVSGVYPSCVNQLPSSEVLIQPSPCMVTIPGPVLSASCDPVVVGGYTACASRGYGFGGYGLSGYGLSGYGGYGLSGYGRRRCRTGCPRRRQASIRRRCCGHPC